MDGVSEIAPGSPPQVRGKQDRLVTYFCTEGITPAGAGKTNIVKKAISHMGDHPRRCGENRHFDSGLAAEVGSPPQVRGKRV